MPKRRPKCTAKLPNVPSESLEKILLKKLLLLLLLLLLPRTSSKAAKLPNVPSESLEKIVVVEKASAAAAATAAAAAATNELQSLHLALLKRSFFAAKHHLISCRNDVQNAQQKCLTSLLNR